MDKVGNDFIVEFQMKLDLDVLKYFQSRAENEGIESLQLLLNRELRNVMKEKQLLKKLKINY